jgi:SAM-dependent methyltransferase
MATIEILKHWVSRLLKLRRKNSQQMNALPEDFDDEAYLRLNPDIRKASVNPRWHYLNYGHKESRPYAISTIGNKTCPVCGSNEFTKVKVLWNELISDWKLSADEVKYIDIQQGLSCAICRNNVRSMVLAKGILNRLGSSQTLQKTAQNTQSGLNILEINNAGNLSPYLSGFPGHVLISYPEADMMNLKFSDETWDLIVHSETLEHVTDPVKGLKETHRVLRKGGASIFTVPIVVGRMTRSRNGLKDSYHGDPLKRTSDYRVVTEFGADIWTLVIQVGFESCKIHVMDYPAGIAIEAIK